MPIYAYKCESCGHRQDVLQKISDPVLTACPACGAETFAKQVTAAGFQLKGSGWYVTDFRDGGAKAKGDAKGEGKSEPGAPPAAEGAAPSADTSKSTADAAKSTADTAKATATPAAAGAGASAPKASPPAPAAAAD